MLGVQLTAFTDLALRIVMRLAVLDDGASASTGALAEDLRINYAHATKVVTALQKLGVVETRRGRAGGLRLAPAGREVSVGAIVRRLEGGDEVVDCDGANPCPLQAACRLRAALREAQEAFFAVLDPLTVADVSAAPTRSLLLSLSPGPPR